MRLYKYATFLLIILCATGAVSSPPIEGDDKIDEYPLSGTGRTVFQGFWQVSDANWFFSGSSNSIHPGHDFTNSDLLGGSGSADIYAVYDGSVDYDYVSPGSTNSWVILDLGETQPSPEIVFNYGHCTDEGGPDHGASVSAGDVIGGDDTAKETSGVHPRTFAEPIAFPNPTTGAVSFGWPVKNENSDFEVTIYDISGRKIWASRVGQTNQVNWNGNDGSGRSISEGVYIVTIEADAEKYTLKLVKE